MKRHQYVCFLVLAASADVTLSQPPEATSRVRARIQGAVRDSNGSPVSRAEVTAKRVRGDEAYRAFTDTGGNFSLSVEHSGIYNVYVAGEGLVPPSSWERYPRVIEVSAGANSKVYRTEFTLHRPSTITGRLLDADAGGPVRAQPVALLTGKRFEGRMTLMQSAVTQTDSKGVFVINDVPPGDYYLQIQPSVTERISPGAAEGPHDAPRVYGYARAYIPAHIDPEHAVPMRVGSGFHDLGTTKIQRQALFRIHATPELKSCSGENATVILQQRYGSSVVVRARAILPCNSPLRIDNLSPGSYHLAMWGLRRSQFEQEIAQAPVVIVDASIEVLLSAFTPRQMRGRVHLPASAQDGVLRNMRVWLWSLGDLRFGADEPVPVDAKGTFMFPILQAGEGRLMVTGLERPFYVREIVYNGTRLVAPILSIDPTAPTHDVELFVSDRPTMIEGVVRDKDHNNLPRMHVLITPWPFVLRRGYPEILPCRSDAQGRFAMPNLIPGSYRAIAVDDFGLSQIQHFESALAAFTNARPIDVQEGTTRAVSLEITPH